ncbi:MAG: PEPxxWA-CTERM sorting domain-containing protein [Sphingomonadaceae bacterium]|nr:PEPxxWA-CTERM sorting domain-containing protein [Sphingomonadaceae bacterium]
MKTKPLAAVAIALAASPALAVANGPGAPGHGVVTIDVPPATLPPVQLPPQVTQQTPPAVTALPEPATWGLLLTGFAATGLAVRRRTRSVAA